MSTKMKSPRVMKLLNDRLKELRMTRTDLIRMFHSTYGDEGSRNHLYKILNGTSMVGEQGLMPKIAKLLSLDEEELKKAIYADKINMKGWGHALPKASKVTQELATVMEGLSHRDQLEVLEIARLKSKKAS